MLLMPGRQRAEGLTRNSDGRKDGLVGACGSTVHVLITSHYLRCAISAEALGLRNNTHWNYTLVAVCPRFGLLGEMSKHVLMNKVVDGANARHAEKSGAQS